MEETVDPVQAFGALVRRALCDAFGAGCADVDPQVRRSDRADLQADVALGLARRLKTAPRSIAERLVGAMPANELIERIEIAGAGFLNVTVRATWLAASATRALASSRLGVPLAASLDRVVIDYSHPNVAKEMHVGHLRSTVIGDALARVLDWRGHVVIRQNHIGDWGTPFGMLIEHLNDLGDARTEAEFAMGDLGGFYRAARLRFDTEPGFADRARARVVALQAGDPGTLERWRVLVALSTRYFEAIYATLDVTLRHTDIVGESFYNDQLAPLAAELEASGYARVSDGALCAFPAGFTNREGEPAALMLRKRDGGFGYAATDLAAIRYRLGELAATRLLYVVGAPQTHHVGMVIAAARELGWLGTQRAEHVAFGSVLGKDGKPLKSRLGDASRLVELVDAAIARADAVTRDKGLANPGPELARIVGVGAIKYADLASDRVKDYIFDVDRLVAIDGNCAGYAQYAYARARSVQRKAAGIPAGPIAVGAPAERTLLLQLLELGGAVAAVEQTLEPHRLVNYIYAVAGNFTAFYDACPILKAEPEVRASRLALVELTARTLAQALSLLGISAPERM